MLNSEISTKMRKIRMVFHRRKQSHLGKVESIFHSFVKKKMSDTGSNKILNSICMTAFAVGKIPSIN